MKPGSALLLFLILALATGSNADTEPGEKIELVKILVTFADPGMTSASRTGPARPGYRRRSSTYLASLTVMRDARRIAEDFGLVTLDDWPIVPLKVHCLVYGVPNDVEMEQLLAKLAKREEIESVQLMNEFEVSVAAGKNSVDPYSKLQHNLKTLELGQAHVWSLGDGTNVTIIDTGADLNHPELKTQISSHHDFVGDELSDFSADAHGTAIAGVIGAAANNGLGMIGVAPSTQLSILRACWYTTNESRASCDSFTLAKALTHAIGSETDIINLSLGGPSDALLGRLLEEALNRGIVIVAAAPTQPRAVFPAEIPGVIVVGSELQAGTSGAALRIQISAPGDDILVPVPQGGYDFASGSSLSAAHVSGIVALLVARRPGLSRDEVTTLLLDSRPTIGRYVNACRALAQLLQRSGCRSSPGVSQVF